MASLSDIVRAHTDIGFDEREHLRRLVGSWGPLADLSFADLLLLAPAGGAQTGQFVLLGHVRPTTTQTIYRVDLLGRFFPMADRPLVERCLSTGKILKDEIDLPVPGIRAQVTAIPVRYRNRIIAAVTRESSMPGHRSLGDLELAYLGAFERLADMIADGAFPFPFEDSAPEHSPRVGDGAMVLDRETAVVYSSPNAVSAFHRLGFHGRIAGRKIEDLGFRAETARTMLTLKVPVIEEIERGDGVAILVRTIPLLLDGKIDGALVLMRDVSEIRSRDRLLVSMDATIREIHHRVKNNLQTVMSLLRIQARRVEAPEAKTAIDEAVRRISSIATVHDLLSRGGGDDVVFSDVVQPILEMAESSGPDPVRVRLVGNGPVLSTTMASSLAVVVNELVQNAVEHGFPPGSGGGSVMVEIRYSPTDLTISVHDDGVGIPDEFDIDRKTNGLGLTIINTLVKGELDGTLSVRPATSPEGGTVAELVVGFRGR